MQKSRRGSERPEVFSQLGPELKTKVEGRHLEQCRAQSGHVVHHNPGPNLHSPLAGSASGSACKVRDQGKGPAPCCALSSSPEHRACGAGICLWSALQPQKTEILPIKAQLRDTTGLAPDHSNKVSRNLFCWGRVLPSTCFKKHNICEVQYNKMCSYLSSCTSPTPIKAEQAMEMITGGWGERRGEGRGERS